MLNINSVSFKNLLSYGNVETTIDFNRDEENQIFGIVGRNGNGKTAILDAVFFALYNSPYRKITKSDLVNRLNKKGLEVKIDFESMGANFIIERGMTPSFIRIIKNGEEIDLEAHANDIQKYIETQVIGVNEKIFRLVFMVGLGVFKSFFTYGIADRRNIFEFIVGINILSLMAKKIKMFNGKIESKLKEVKMKIDKYENLNEVYVEKLEDINKINSSVDYTDDITATKKEIDQLKKEISKINIDKTEESLEKNNKMIKKLEKDIRTLENEIRDSKKDVRTNQTLLDFYEDNDVCDRCHQTISEDFKTEIMDKLETTIGDASKILKKSEDELDKISEKVEKVEDKKDKLEDIVDKYDDFVENKESYEKQLKKYEEMNVKTDTDTGDVIKKINDDIASTKEQLKKYNKKVKGIEAKLEMNKLFLITLSDKGVKKYIYNVLLKKINRYVNKYISEFNFNGKLEIKGDLSEKFYYRSGDKIKYASFSNGEKLIIDFSFILGIMQFLEEFYGFTSNIIFFDEILDTSLDSVNKQFLLENLKKINKNIVIISHDYNMTSSFDTTFTVTKESDFSVIEEV